MGRHQFLSAALAIVVLCASVPKLVSASASEVKTRQDTIVNKSVVSTMEGHTALNSSVGVSDGIVVRVNDDTSAPGGTVKLDLSDDTDLPDGNENDSKNTGDNEGENKSTNDNDNEGDNKNTDDSDNDNEGDNKNTDENNSNNEGDNKNADDNENDNKNTGDSGSDDDNKNTNENENDNKDADESKNDDENDDEDVESATLYLLANKRYVSEQESLKLSAYFDDVVVSNTAELVCIFNEEIFEYQEFIPADNVTVLATVRLEGQVRILVGVPDYETSKYGEFYFLSKESADFSDGETYASLIVEYVEKSEDEEKQIKTATAEMSLSEQEDVNGDGIIDLLDLSDLIDVFGIDNTNELWDEYKRHDYNENECIDIYDITYIARLVLILNDIDTTTFLNDNDADSADLGNDDIDSVDSDDTDGNDINIAEIQIKDIERVRKLLKEEFENYDSNENDSIDIHDITFVAQQVLDEQEPSVNDTGTIDK